MTGWSVRHPGGPALVVQRSAFSDTGDEVAGMLVHHWLSRTVAERADMVTLICSDVERRARSGTSWLVGAERPDGGAEYVAVRWDGAAWRAAPIGPPGVVRSRPA